MYSRALVRLSSIVLTLSRVCYGVNAVMIVAFV